jgi:hypothetical protein
MSTVNYVADCYELHDEREPNKQSVWICLFNPTKYDANLMVTFYYEEIEPTYTMLKIPSECRRNLHTFESKDVIKNKRFGVKILSNVPIIVQSTVGYYGPEDKHDWYTRAMTTTLAATCTSKIWYYADGIVIDRPSQRLKESEILFLLNPSKRDAEVTFTAYYDDQRKDEFKFNVPAERLKMVLLDDLVIKNKSYGAKIVSTEPIVVQETREIWEEDRIVKRAAFSTIALPSPLCWETEPEP